MRGGTLRMKKYLRYILPVAIVGIVFLIIYVYRGFHQKDLATWMVGQTDEDHYPDWEEDVEILEAERNILKEDHLFFSKVYFIKRSDSYQIRFRIAYSVPFLRSSLFEDLDWVKLEDSDGNDYTEYLTVYTSRIAGLNCVNATLVMDEEIYSALSGGKLNVSAVCTEGGLNGNENSYASCQVEILVPERNKDNFNE